MSKVRNAYFSGSWYPGTSSEVFAQLEKWEKKLGKYTREIISGVVPHAGWFFSGIFAYDVIRRIEKSSQVIVVAGGHLPEEYPFLYCNEDFVETPCGNLEIDRDFINHISAELDSKIDNRADNTIEVQLPIIKALHKNVKIVPVRVPSGEKCLELVNVICNYAISNNINISFIGSTDLTHYGPNYDFTPEGSSKAPLEWVKKSDERILNAMVDLKPLSIIEEAKDHQSACSAGAAACAAEFASIKGVGKGHLLSYDTSYSKHQSDSFVGYGAVVYET